MSLSWLEIALRTGFVVGAGCVCGNLPSMALLLNLEEADEESDEDQVL